jgi:hypothetical protein
MATVLNRRGTRANLDVLASSNGLNAGEIYLITDENRIAVGLSASDYQVYQKEFSGNRVSGVYYMGGNVNTATYIATGAPNTIGTLTGRAFGTSNKLTASKRLGFVSAATIGSLCGIYSNGGLNGFIYPTSSGLGSFEISFRFGCSDAATVSGARGFIGIAYGTASQTNVEPSALTNVIGIAQLSTDATQYYLVYGGSSAQTPIALGTALGSPADKTTLIDFKITAINDTSFRYRVKNLSNGVAVSGTVTGTASTQIPAATTTMFPRLWRCNNATALAVAIDICFIHSESEL